MKGLNEYMIKWMERLLRAQSSCPELESGETGEESEGPAGTTEKKDS